MRLLGKLAVFVFGLFLVACEGNEPIDRKPVVLEEEKDGLKFTFSIETANGETATVYRVGEGIVSHFNVTNVSQDTVYVSYSYSNPYSNDTFGAIFSLDGHYLYRPIFNYDNTYTPCRHLAPGEAFDWKLNNPEDGTSSLGYLPEGNYCVKFNPNFGYHSECKCGQSANAKEGMTVLDLPEQRIEFEVIAQ